MLLDLLQLPLTSKKVYACFFAIVGKKQMLRRNYTLGFVALIVPVACHSKPREESKVLYLTWRSKFRHGGASSRFHIPHSATLQSE